MSASRIAALAIAATIVLAPATAIAAAKPSVAQAKRAVRREVQNRFLEARAIDVYSCKQLTARRFKCSWNASEQASGFDGKHGHAYGDARVTVYQYGMDARLSNITCHSALGPTVGPDFCIGVTP